MYKIGIIREEPRIGEISNMELFDKYNLNPSLISPKNNYSKNIKPLLNMCTKQLSSIQQLNKMSFLSQLLQHRYSINGYMFNFNKTVKDMDLLLPTELCSMSTYQSIKSGKPTIIKVWENIPYNWILFSYFDKIKKISNPKITEFAIKNADFFLPVSELSKKVLLFQGVDEEKMEVIGEPVDTNLFKPIKVLKEDIFTLLFIGRLSWDKGINNLLFAIKSLLDEGVKLNLILIGEGHLKNRIVETIKYLKLQDNITLIPSIEHRDLVKWYNQADVFVLPSMPNIRWTEQWGKVLSEAMSCEMPVISTHSGTIPELIENEKSGLLVQPYDWVDLKEAILRLKEDKQLRKKLGRNARKAMLKFDNKVITKKLVRLYKQRIEK